ncbi:Tat pathway signal protein [Streptomyces bacillaris]|uniref:Tat pathway signal protein n=1 Tax=Streptomyces bacillaris TaxID=68179 RepID=UPI00362AB60A
MPDQVLMPPKTPKLIGRTGDRMARTRNIRLAALIREADWSQEQTAAQFVRVAVETGVPELLGTRRSHVSMWVLGTRPTGQAPAILCETLSRRLQRRITPAEAGLASAEDDPAAAPEWSTDNTLAVLTDLGRSDLDSDRRQLLSRTAYSVTGLGLPGRAWWDDAPAQSRERVSPTGRRVGATEVEAVREMTAFFSRRDQRWGGAGGRAPLVQYLCTDLATYLGGSFPDERVRRDLFAAAAELTYLCGWMSFDASHHGAAQKYYTLAVRLAAEADDAPLAGHILRAMAHQAVDLGHVKQAVDLAAASMERRRYALAGPREKALLSVVQARSLASAGRKKDALGALLRAEDDLASAGAGDEEPQRVWFFSEASLAHETACTLRDLGDLPASQREFRRSVRTREASTFSRTHSVTLGYLGAVQARQGQVEATCATWSRALDIMEGVNSGRARETVITMRRALSPFRNRDVGVIKELDSRARTRLGRVT